ncbi:MAG: hypothetical protein HYU99_11505 [Deltaproteobacteria bacterium]|nr:hypothetical protein [Deltaproteobacteria bacterium]
MNRPSCSSIIIHTFFVAALALFAWGDCSGGGSSSKTTLYKDADADGYGDPNTTEEFKTGNTETDDETGLISGSVSESVSGLDGATATVEYAYVSDNTDCDDTSADANPGVEEVADDGIDNDCDGSADEGEEATVDADADGYSVDTDGLYSSDREEALAQSLDCDDTSATIHPGASEVNGDGIDQNCDGEDDFESDADGDGHSSTAAGGDDCDDTNDEINPDATEKCDDVDNDCDDTVDESDASDVATWYLDSDSDGYGDSANRTTACDQPTGYVDNGNDCDDTSSSLNPAATDTEDDGIDQDCSGADAQSVAEQMEDEDIAVIPSTETSCSNGTDDDADGLTDCNDVGDCSDQKRCWATAGIWRGFYFEEITSDESDEKRCEVWDNTDREINFATSYLNKVDDESVSTGGTAEGKLEFKTRFGDNEDYRARSYGTLLAYNTGYLKIIEGDKAISCSESTAASGVCTGTETVTLNSEIEYAEEWLGDDKKVVVLLRGYNFDVDGGDAKEVRDHNFQVYLDHDSLSSYWDSSSQTYKVPVKFETDFNADREWDYATTLYYTLIVYDSDYFTWKTVDIGSDSWTDKGHYKEVTKNDSDTTFSTSWADEIDVDNAFVGLRSNGWDKSNDYEIYQAWAYIMLGTDNSDDDGYTASSSKAKITGKGVLYSVCDSLEAKPDQMVARIMICRGDNVCKATESDGYTNEDLGKTGTNSDIKTQDTPNMSITGLDF